MAKKLEDSKMVLRGVSWGNEHLPNMRFAYRFWHPIINRNPFYGYRFGFRVCRPVAFIKQVKRWKDETEGGLFDG